ncbi:hypothetical protein Pfo_020315, partial [Paulownia fortunei]
VHLDTKQKFPSHGRKAIIEQFHAVILPYLEHLYDSSLESDSYQDEVHGYDRIHLDVDLESEDECGICLEPCTKTVLLNCCHAMNMRSESCPFGRGSLKRVSSGDMWVLTCCEDVVDQETLPELDMLRFTCV